MRGRDNSVLSGQDSCQKYRKVDELRIHMVTEILMSPEKCFLKKLSN